VELLGDTDYSEQERSMTITNREIFYRDPTGTKIPNDGVVQVIRPESDQQWDVLRWELKSFVCDGEYARGLERILNSFLTNLSQAQQPAVWVSGFYGSGKSHLVRVLEYLWRDIEMPGGESARSLVTLPDDIRDHLTELSTVGKRLGGLRSAAGTLASGKSDAVRLAFLSVLFESAALPEQYPLARFVIWAMENGYLAEVTAAVDAAGKSFDKEVHDLYVSRVIAKALLEADDSLGDSVKDVRELLKTQFPPTTKDITDDEMFGVMDDVLRLQSTTEGKLPLTLVVLDEMQQYIGEDNEKALAVQNIVEGCSARFESQVMFVATGQSALTATPTLQKLTDRFAVQVALSDHDVESVVRQVVLRKQPEHVPALKAALERVSGEIDRHLGGTQLAPKAADKQDLVPDYPLLPTRRRFWELVLRAIDRAGKAGVLRTQLKIVHEAARDVAHAPIGHVVGGEFVYEQQSPGMLQSGVLLKEIDELIRGLRAEGADGELKSRICALIFLISQVPSRTLGGETGLRATAPFLADLLVEDLAADGAQIRKRVPELLDALVTEGRLMRIDADEYRLQTEEGAEWEKDYQSRLAVIRDDAGRMSQLRNERLLEAVDAALGGLKLTHGTSKTPRRIDLHWGQDEPTVSEGDVPVWIRDEWSVTEAAVKKSAAEAGDESPIVFVYLPKREVDQIREMLASYTSAQDTVQQKPTPQTDEGKAAQRAMKTRFATDEERLSSLFQDVVAHARVFQGGGAEVTTSSLRNAVEIAAGRSLIRLFPKFAAGDNANWGKVVTKARDGAPDALSAVGHDGEPITHPVCKEVLAATSAGGTKGAELQKRFATPDFGWPKDAVNGAILTLLASGNIRAAQDGKPLAGPKELPQTQIGKVTLYKEDEPPTVGQRLAVKGLLTAAGIAYEAGQEGSQIPALLQRLKDLASRSGGLPPLPEPPDTDHIDALQALGGNQLFRAVAKDHDRLSDDLERWRAADQQRERRETGWHDLQRLLRHAEDLPIASTVEPAARAIRDGRQLLDDPDPIAPLLVELTDALRSELKQRSGELASAQRGAVEELEASDEWRQLGAGKRQSLIEDAKLVPATTPDVFTHTKLLQALDAIPLSGWQDRISLVSARRDQARQHAAMELEPESVRVAPPSATLKTSDDLDEYLDGLRAQVRPHLDANKTVII
jgi:hypothetical protein